MNFAETIKFLNENSGALTVIFTAVVTLSTVVYAFLTAVLVRETKKMREAQTEPKLQLQLTSLDFAINIIRIDIKNFGLGAAQNVMFRYKVKSGGEGAKNLLEEFTKSKFFKSGLSYFGPGQKIHSRCTSMLKDYDSKIGSILDFEVSYQGPSGKKYHENFLIDISEMEGLQRLGKPSLYSIAQSLESMNKALDYLTTGIKKLQIDIFTSKDRDRKYQENLEAIKKFEEENS